MATKASTTTGKDATKGPAALDRLGGSLDAAGEALKDLRRELSKGGRDALRDFDTLLKDARKNLRGARRTLLRAPTHPSSGMIRYRIEMVTRARFALPTRHD